jgi:predicted transcriptional regulator
MKTAISLPDHLFEAAEKLARRLGISRSELYQRAIAQLVSEHQDSDITNRLNLVHGEDTGLDEAWKRAQSEVLARDRW